MEQQKTLFSPLDLLANAALQTAHIGRKNGRSAAYCQQVVLNGVSNGEAAEPAPVTSQSRLDGQCVVRLVGKQPAGDVTTAAAATTSAAGRRDTAPAQKDGDVFAVPSNALALGGGRKMTVVNINKQQRVPEQPYTYVCQLDRAGLAGREDDEGYSSRSSMDSPTDGLRSPGARSPGARSPEYVYAEAGSDVTPKHTKIIIVSSKGRERLGGRSAVRSALSPQTEGDDVTKTERRPAPAQPTQVTGSTSEANSTSEGGEATLTDGAGSAEVTEVTADGPAADHTADAEASIQANVTADLQAAAVTSHSHVTSQSEQLQAALASPLVQTVPGQSVVPSSVVSQLTAPARPSKVLVVPPGVSSQLSGGKRVLYSLPALVSGAGASRGVGPKVYLTAPGSALGRPRTALLQSRGPQTLILPAGQPRIAPPKTQAPRAQTARRRPAAPATSVSGSHGNQYIIQDALPPLTSAGLATPPDASSHQSPAPAPLTSQRSILINKRPQAAVSLLEPAAPPAAAADSDPSRADQSTPDAPEAFIVRTDHGELTATPTGRVTPACSHDSEETSSLPGEPTPSEAERPLLDAEDSLLESPLSEEPAVTARIGHIGSLSLGPAPTPTPDNTHSYVKRRRKSPHTDVRKSPRKAVPSPRVQAAVTLQQVDLVSQPEVTPPQELHPVVEHDYCAFTAFNAEIQSSILATTQCKPKLGDATRGRKGAYMSRGKPRRYTKRRDRLGQLAVDVEVSHDQELSSPGSTASDPCSPDARAPRRGRRPKNWPGDDRVKKNKKRTYSTTSFNSQNTTYQDEFVYYGSATARKKHRKTIDAPWKEEMEPMAPKSKPREKKRPQVGGMKLFDWYREMAEEKNKMERFNTDITTPTASHPPSPEAGILQEGVLPESAGIEKRFPATTPVHESEVADLVCELETMPVEPALPAGGFGLPGHHGDLVSGAPDLTMDLRSMEELARSMISDMGEADLLELGQSLTNNQVKDKLRDEVKDRKDGVYGDAVKSNAMEATPVVTSQRVEPERPEAGVGEALRPGPGSLLSPPPGSLLPSGVGQPAGLLPDLQDIDFLPADNITHLLNDLTPEKTSLTDSPDRIKSIKQGLLRLQDPPLEGAAVASPACAQAAPKVRVCPAVCAPVSDDVTQIVEGVPLVCDEHTVPELTVVSLFWNDLPAVNIGGTKYIRLVDIHKQVLPSKDVGILKKRCQALRVGLYACTEMQRDFLIRYAHSAKSKSQVVVDATTAETLIGFYAGPHCRDVTKSGKMRVVRDDSDLRSAGRGARGRPPLSVSPGDGVASFARRRLTAPVPGVGASRSRRNVKRIKYDKLQDGELETASTGDEDDTDDADTEEAEDDVTTQEADEDDVTEEQPQSLKIRIPRAVLASPELSRPPPRRHKFPEEYEMLRLKNRARRDVITPAERLRLSHLRGTVRRKHQDWLRMREAKLQKAIRKLISEKDQESDAEAPPPLPDGDVMKTSTPRVRPAAPLQEANAQVHVPLSITHKEAAPQRRSPRSPGNRPRLPRTKRCSVELDRNQPLSIVHRDNTARAARGKAQEGEVHLHLYQNEASPCVSCATCREFLSVRKFLRHQHVRGQADELVDVYIPQCVDMRSGTPTPQETRGWAEFRRRLARHDPAIPVPRPQDDKTSFKQALSKLSTTCTVDLTPVRPSSAAIRKLSLNHDPDPEVKVTETSVKEEVTSKVETDAQVMIGTTPFETPDKNSPDAQPDKKVEFKVETSDHVVPARHMSTPCNYTIADLSKLTEMASPITPPLRDGRDDVSAEVSALTSPSSDVISPPKAMGSSTSACSMTSSDSSVLESSCRNMEYNDSEITKATGGGDVTAARVSGRQRKRKHNEDYVYAGRSPGRPEAKKHCPSTSDCEEERGRRSGGKDTLRTPPGAERLKQELRRLGMPASPQRRRSRGVLPPRSVDARTRSRSKK